MQDKKSLTRLRKFYVETLPKAEKNLVLEAEERWGKYCFLPLDIPVIVDEKLTSWFLENKKPSHQMRTSDCYLKGNGDANNPYYVFETIDVCNGFLPRSPYWAPNYKPEFRKEFKNIYDQIMEFFPVKYLNLLKIVSSVKDVDPHRDQTFFIDVPLSFRVMIYDNNPESTLWVKDSPPEKTLIEKKFLIPRIETSNSFVWNNLRTVHGSSKDQQYFKLVLMLNDFIVDWRKLSDLFEKSVSKYQDNLFVSENLLFDYIEPNSLTN